jgi:hypothetical protein
MKKIKLTQADIDANPLIKKIGAKAGQTMEYTFVTSSKTKADATTTTEDDNEGGEDDGEDGGGNHPGKRPKN